MYTHRDRGENNTLPPAMPAHRAENSYHFTNQSESPLTDEINMRWVPKTPAATFNRLSSQVFFFLIPSHLPHQRNPVRKRQAGFAPRAFYSPLHSGSLPNKRLAALCHGRHRGVLREGHSWQVFLFVWEWERAFVGDNRDKVSTVQYELLIPTSLLSDRRRSIRQNNKKPVL